MKDTREKIDDLASDVHEIKISITKLEGNYDKTTEILDRLTTSVEHHIRRTDELQDLVTSINLQQQLTSQRLDNQNSRVRLVMYVLGAIGTTVLFLNELGILQKLF